MVNKNQIINSDKLLKEFAEKQVKDWLISEGRYFDKNSRKFVLYLRKSTKGTTKDKDGNVIERQEMSIPQQREACLKFAEKEGIQILHVFHDEDSAYKKDKARDDFNEMMKSMKKGQFNSILAWHPDRLARNMKDAGEIIDLIDRGKILDLKFPTFYFERDTNGVMILGIQFVMAKQYSDSLSKNVTRGTLDKAKNGKPPNGIAPMGYTLNKEGFMRPDGRNFILIQQAFKKALQRESLSSIAEWLNKQKFSYREKETNISKQKLSANIFSKTVYAGLYVYSTEIIDIMAVDPEFTPMVSSDDFLELRRILEETSGYKKSSGSDLVLYKGLVTCGYCNNKMTPGRSRSRTNQLYLYIDCKNRDCPSKKQKPRVSQSVRSYILTDKIAEILSVGVKVSRKNYDQYVSKQKAEIENDLEILSKRVTEQKKQLEDIEKQINGLTRLIGNIEENDPLQDIKNQDFNEKVSAYYLKKSNISAILKQNEEALSSARYTYDNKIMSYENFSNYFKNLDTRIKNTDNTYELDHIIRMVVSNFILKDKKILITKLNSSFEPLLNVAPSETVVAPGLEPGTSRM